MTVATSITVDGNFRHVMIGNNTDLFFSYNTLIAVQTPKGCLYSQNPAGATTGKHLGMVPGYRGAKERGETLPPDVFAAQASALLSEGHGL